MTKNNTIAVLPVLFGFFIMGFCDLVGISVTYAREQFQWGETQAGLLPSMVFLWFLVLSIPTAMLMDKIGRKKTVLAGMLFTFAGMLLPFVLFNESTCYLAFAFLGIGNTVLQVSLNPLLTNVVNGERLTSSLNTGQLIKALSSFLGPILAGYCSVTFGRWELVFPLYAAITCLSSLWLILTPIQQEKSETISSSFGQILGLLGDRTILFLFLGILCIVGLDVGMNIVTPKLLLERIPGTGIEAAGYGSSWYFAARTIGTACGAFLLIRIPEKIFFRINMVIAILAVTALLFAGSRFLILGLVCVVAFTCSSVFAIFYSMALKARPEKANEISGLMITGVSGGAFFPFLMGIAADATGNQTGSVGVVLLTAFYLFYCAFGSVCKK
ncbi:MAG: MFS transporter [Tannerellaceae bacterium]|nr:MFS transporter [Tannerellaceae bacterium]